ncbi:hypothetical protein NBRC110019_25010 [Neptunitalea chrysea]|uniref:DUF3078 domain-containing protein n=1 Tax=Neptunitalea chrysea TaxID=1647581 RepID=A0A9W6B867_9FLAO|nr:DUF3078 domain-containing protein [Neptunitalea chrysea]GLB53460.1 hypothetical protein NBRC110019_25010 [Neptunitalea chrysea]
MSEILNLKFDYVDKSAPIKQTDKKQKTKKEKVIPEASWIKSNKISVNLNEVAFSNWNAGGENSISAITKGTFSRKYEDRYLQWSNEMVLKYGLNLQEGQGIRKTDDGMSLNSTFGYRKDSLSYWFYSAKLTFNSQFSNGYNYPDKDNPISRFMAPGYLFVGLGMEYSDTPEKLTVYISPGTFKATFVLDQDLANNGSFGVTGARYDSSGNIIEEGKKYFGEFGILVSGTWKKKLYDNMAMNNSISFYTDYINSFGNIDIDWEMSVDLTVNKFVKANIGTHIKYDDDVKFVSAEDENGNDASYGARMQLKQLLGVGLSYSF